jgi:hypothetical protein
MWSNAYVSKQVHNDMTLVHRDYLTTAFVQGFRAEQAARDQAIVDSLSRELAPVLKTKRSKSRKPRITGNVCNGR